MTGAQTSSAVIAVVDAIASGGIVVLRRVVGTELDPGQPPVAAHRVKSALTLAAGQHGQRHRARLERLQLEVDHLYN